MRDILLHSNFKKYFSNASWLLLEKIIRMIIGLLVMLLVARYLGPEKFGQLNYAQSFVFIFSAIASLGLSNIVIKELVNGNIPQEILLGTSFLLKLIGSLTVLLILTIVTQLVGNDSFTNILITIIALSTIVKSFGVIDFYFQSKVLSKYVVYASIISFLITSLLKILFIILNAQLIMFSWVILIESIITSFGLVVYFNKSGYSIFRWKYKYSTAINLLKQSWPLMFVGIASVLNMRMDQVFLGKMLNTVVVGNYAAAIRISELWLILPIIVGSSIYPAIISAKKEGEKKYRKRVFKTIKYMSIFSIPFAVIITLLAEVITKLLYGSEYSSTGIYLAITIWIGVPYAIFFVLNHVFIIEGLTKYNFYISIFIVLLNTILNVLLIPIYGGIGAALATLSVSILSFTVTFAIVYRKSSLFR